jgi:hypothetical protein
LILYYQDGLILSGVGGYFFVFFCFLLAGGGGSSFPVSFLAKIFVVFLYLFAALLISSEDICHFPLSLRHALYQTLSLYQAFQKASAATPQRAFSVFLSKSPQKHRKHPFHSVQPKASPHLSFTPKIKSSAAAPQGYPIMFA